MTSAPTRKHIARLWPLVSAGTAILFAVALGALIFYREQNKPFGFELEWMGEIVEHRAPFFTNVALVFNFLGGGIMAIIVIPVLIIVGLLVWRRPWAALYFAIAEIVNTIIVQLLKAVIDRPRPTDILVVVDPGSFPSGHSANAALIAAVLGIVFMRAWVWIAGAVYTAAMMASRTYLGAHWISDTVGGFLIGAGVAVVVWAPFAYRLYREAEAEHPPIWKPRTPVTA